MRVDLKAGAGGDGPIAEDTQEGRIEGTRSECGVQKSDRLAPSPSHAARRAEDLARQKTRGCELTHRVPFAPAPRRIQIRLHPKALSLQPLHRPNSAKSSMRCSQTQSIPSAASYPR